MRLTTRVHMNRCVYNAYMHYMYVKTVRLRLYFELELAKVGGWMDVNVYGSDWSSDQESECGGSIAPLTWRTRSLCGLVSGCTSAVCRKDCLLGSCTGVFPVGVPLCRFRSAMVHTFSTYSHPVATSSNSCVGLSL